MYNNNERISNAHQRMPPGILQAGGQQRLQQQQQSTQGLNGRSLWQNSSQQFGNQQSSMLGVKSTTRNVHGKQPMLMANNDVFSIGPYKARKDSTRISVLEKYEIIGYIAAGTYGKVYKAKRRAGVRDDNINTDSVNTEANSSDLTGLQVGQSAFNDNSHHSGTISANGSFNPSEPGTASLRAPDQNAISSSGAHPSISTRTSNNDSTSKFQLSRTKHSSVYYAIKKFKTERDGVEQLHYTGISQSACREMALCRELDNKHLTQLAEIFLERKSIYMVYEFAEHDLLQIIHFHSHPEKRMIPQKMIGSIMWQILDGVSYLHQNWILHRDLKPANIMVTVDGCVKVGDLGLARKFCNMLQTLYTGDKVVVTIWYRAPELLLGARHYTPAIDLWAVGCIFAELIGLQPIFKGEEAKIDSKKSVPFQANQLQRILEVLGTPNQKNWPHIQRYPEYEQLGKFPKYRDNLGTWYHSAGGRDKNALDLLYKLLTYDPTQRIDAINALDHEYFTSGEFPVCENVFEGLNYKYPARRIHTNDNDITNLGVHKNKNLNAQQPAAVTNSSTAALGGLGVNRRILAAAAAAAAAVSGNNLTGQPSSRNGEPNRKKRK
ncbi:ZYBA0S09-04610g1_1 [Zygosaccharomyces bailii CLIB 213]|uniref:Cyclin-dependent kinase 8 n=1 Tax=Zygosaccharomyces bailii (strain CLIB 213 / ATCC 58445 / CBS 680 / BCRC 21525 / NBRC 1098 / NCYC 1416 / NRRL Y-2227) TaxID=1333698 RepID=A0A8J2T9Q9_ZYGB2|nr:ZYBA0S09-04610g1_1 [Zygosaccharomyces bailii CLIB 213]